MKFEMKDNGPKEINSLSLEERVDLLERQIDFLMDCDN